MPTKMITSGPTAGLRPEEQAVIDAVCREYSGTWQPGEDPPDAYLCAGGRRIAVEISSLYQPIVIGEKAASREGVDHATRKLAELMSAKLGPDVPDGFRLTLILQRTPLNDLRRFRRELPGAVRSVLPEHWNALSPPPSRIVVVCGNEVDVFIDWHGDPNRGKVDTASISGTADVLENVVAILRDRIKTKQDKCLPFFSNGPVWLALSNEYWLTNADTYRLAMSHVDVAHSFDAILIVSASGKVDPIFTRSNVAITPVR